MRIRSLIIGSLVLVAVLLLQAVGNTGEFEQAVLTRLTRSQILSYLRTVDTGQSATDLGAKYLWGSVPLDREPPAYLGEWWGRLSTIDREEKMVRWFRTHLGAIDLKEVERHLDISNLVDEVHVSVSAEADERVRPWWVREREESEELDDPAEAEPEDEPVPAAPTPRPRRPRRSQPVPAAAPTAVAVIPAPPPLRAPAVELGDREPVETFSMPAETELPLSPQSTFLPISLRNQN